MVDKLDNFNKLLAEAIRIQNKLEAKKELVNRIGWAIIDALEDNELLVRRVFGHIEDADLANAVGTLENEETTSKDGS